MKPQSWKPTLGALALVVAVNAPLAAPDAGESRAFRIELAGMRYRLELTGPADAPNAPFAARMFRLGERRDTSAVRTELPVAVTPIPLPPSTFRVEPDAVWTVTPLGATTEVVIRVGPDRIEALLPAYAATDAITPQAGICGPGEITVVPLLVEANGVPVRVPETSADLQAKGAAGTLDAVPLQDAAAFLQGFGELYGLVAAALGPTAMDFDSLAKSSCMGPCAGCMGSILRLVTAHALTVSTCVSAIGSGGLLTPACVIGLVASHGLVIETGASCSECDRCRAAQRRSGSNDDDDDADDEPCQCPCEGQPLCDCLDYCPLDDDDDLP